MGKIKKRLPVKLITGLIFKKNTAVRKAKSILSRHFGRIDFESPVLPFKHTDYYQKEFGASLKRQFLSFQKLIDPAALSKVKVLTNKIEIKLSAGKKRLINIDPGYLDLAKLVLATTKDYSHRIYLDAGIYAEVTLFFEDKKFKPYSWTYPDYRTDEYAEIFHKIRNIYLCALPT